MRIFVLTDVVESLPFSKISLNANVTINAISFNGVIIGDGTVGKFIVFNTTTMAIEVKDSITTTDELIGSIEEFNGYSERVVILSPTIQLSDTGEARMLTGSYSMLIDFLTPKIDITEKTTQVRVKTSYDNICPKGNYLLNGFELSPFSDIQLPALQNNINCYRVDDEKQKDYYDPTTKQFNLTETGLYVISIGKPSTSKNNFMEFNVPSTYTYTLVII